VIGQRVRNRQPLGGFSALGGSPYKDMKYDPLVDLTPVSLVISAPSILVVSSPA
jgi:hypothetical protein